MKTDVKVEIRSALIANQKLVSLLGGQRVYQLAAPNAEEYPRITFFEIENSDSQFADNEVYATEVFVQIDVWSKGSTSEISGEVDRAMRQLEYSRYGGADLYEPDTKVFHKALRYRRTFEEG